MLPYIGILPIYWQYASYCRGALVRHIAGRSGPTMFSRSQEDHALIFFGFFFWEKLLPAQEASNTTIKPVRATKDRNQEPYWQYIGNILPN